MFLFILCLAGNIALVSCRGVWRGRGSGLSVPLSFGHAQAPPPFFLFYSGRKQTARCPLFQMGKVMTLLFIQLMLCLDWYHAVNAQDCTTAGLSIDWLIGCLHWRLRVEFLRVFFLLRKHMSYLYFHAEFSPNSCLMLIFLSNKGEK